MRVTLVVTVHLENVSGLKEGIMCPLFVAKRIKNKARVVQHFRKICAGGVAFFSVDVKGFREIGQGLVVISTLELCYT